jgi:hypothetical protein
MPQLRGNEPILGLNSVDVGKKEDHEDISNEGKEHSKTLDYNDNDDEFFSTSEE